MDIAIGHALFQAFRNDRFFFGYSGVFRDDHTERLLQLSDAIVDEVVVERSSRKKLAFLLIEAYQNIIRHRAELPPHVARGEGRSLFLFRADPEGQDLVAINGVHKRNVPDMERQLDAISGLDRSQLKEISMQMLVQGSKGERGAGVGLIEMARRSGNDLGYMLRGLGPEHNVFALAVRLGQAYPHEKVIRDGAVLHGTVVMNDILLFQTGVMPANVRRAMADIVREDSDERSARAHAREAVYLTAIDAVDQVRAGRRGVCVLAKEGDHYALVQGTLLSPEEAAVHEQELEAISRMDHRALDLDLLEELVEQQRSGARIALLKLALSCRVPLVHRSFPTEEGVLVLVKAVF
ncbi:MAG TPA: DUF6272 family protein [Flavobacteriales bacterium]|jgi:hypothetical protein|nr:DUF6272 family protein [Flavobacteriales bacterium]